MRQPIKSMRSLIANIARWRSMYGYEYDPNNRTMTGQAVLGDLLADMVEVEKENLNGTRPGRSIDMVPDDHHDAEEN